MSVFQKDLGCTVQSPASLYCPDLEKGVNSSVEATMPLNITVDVDKLTKLRYTT